VTEKNGTNSLIEWMVSNVYRYVMVMMMHCYYYYRLTVEKCHLGHQLSLFVTC